MKLRISGNSIRLRLLRSEVSRFIETGRIEEKVYVSADAEALLTYALEWDFGAQDVQVRSRACEVIVVLPKGTAGDWAQSEQVGVYATVEIGSHGMLAIVVEKDFACLDRSDADNEDTFPHPELGAVC